MSWDYVTLDKLGSISRGKSKHRPRNDRTLFGASILSYKPLMLKLQGYI